MRCERGELKKEKEWWVSVLPARMWAGCTNCFPAPTLQGGFATSLDPPAGIKNENCMEPNTGKGNPCRTKRLHIRLNAEEKSQLLAVAKEHGLSISDFVRVTIIRSQPVMPKAKPDRALFIRTLGELGKIGSNVNQIAHALHQERLVGNGHHVPDRIIEGALAGVKTLSDQLIHILKGDTEV